MMDNRVQSFLDKVKSMADKTGEIACHAADTAGKKTTEFASTARLNLKLFDLNTECDALYREVGKMVYDLNRGGTISNEEIENKLTELDEKQAQITSLREKIADAKDTVVCPACGRKCCKDDTYCANCGAPLSGIVSVD